MTHHDLQTTTIASVLEHLIEEGLEGLASAILAEASDEWETGRVYLRMEAE